MGLTEDNYFLNRYRKLGWRRRKTLIRPLVMRIPWLRKKRRARKRAEDFLVRADRRINRMLTTRYARKRDRPVRVRVID